MTGSAVRRALPMLSVLALLLAALSAATFTTAPHAIAASSPVPGKGTVGWDTLRRLDALPYLSPGTQTRQSSSFDRYGNNGDFGRCLTNAGGGCTIAEDSGPGEVDSIWFTRDSGDVTKDGTLTVVLDGTTVLSGSLQSIVNGSTGAPFVYPLVANADQSSGGVYIKVPMPYRASMRITVSATDPNYYHVAYRQFTDATGVTTFSRSDTAADVRATLAASGTQDPKPAHSGAMTTPATVNLAAGASANIAALSGPGAISALRVRLPSRTAANLAGIRVRISFDGHTTVDSPVGEFFGDALGEYGVKSLMFAMSTSDGWYSSWWPMPYASSATVQLVNTTGTALSGVQTQVTSAPDSQWSTALSASGGAGYFYAISAAGNTVAGQDWMFADVTGRGRFVGVSHGMRNLSGGRAYLEGDERAYVDGARTPNQYGTGTEDFYEGGWYFNRGVFSDPFNGNTAHQVAAGGCANECDATYRVMLGESIGFDAAFRMGIEHGPTDDIQANYSSTAFLYLNPSMASRTSDTVILGDAASRSAHSYTDGSATQTSLSSTFEGDDDNVPVSAAVRSTSSPVSMKLAVDSGNGGVVLHRTSDQNASYQSAAVAVDGVAVGTWRQPFGNTFSRWLDDTFALPASATAGKASITVTLTPSSGAPAWTASAYRVESLVTPFVDPTAPSTPGTPVVSGSRVHAIHLSWSQATDNVGVNAYRVYASTSSSVPVSTSTLVGTTHDTRFVHQALAAKQTWYYRVVAVDDSGNASAPSTTTSATTVVSTRSDFTGDGRDDVATFTRGSDAKVYAAVSTGSSFSGDGVQWHPHFAANSEIPLTGDFNGDGKDDIATFVRGTSGTVFVALSNGSSFGTASVWHAHFCLGSEIPAVGDVNGDGKDDIITFTRGDAADVFVALSTGSSFSGDGLKWHDHFAVGSEIPQVGDVNGDGFADIVTFTRGTTKSAYVAFSDGATRFVGDTWRWNADFAPGSQVPALGDANGDGRDDAIAFTYGSTNDVFVAASNGTSFGSAAKWADTFGVGSEIVGTGDFDGDGRSDVVSFTRGDAADVYVATSTGSAYPQVAWKWHDHFCAGTEWPQPTALTP